MRGNNDRRYGASYKGATPAYPSAQFLRMGEGTGAGVEETGACERVEPLADSVNWEDDRPIVAVLGLLVVSGILPLAISWAAISIIDGLGCWWVVPLAYASAAIYAYRRWMR